MHLSTSDEPDPPMMFGGAAAVDARAIV